MVSWRQQFQILTGKFPERVAYQVKMKSTEISVKDGTQTMVEDSLWKKPNLILTTPAARVSGFDRDVFGQVHSERSIRQPSIRRLILGSGQDSTVEICMGDS
ncbi:hypothetical protein GJ744_008910 [Endocarpon pusillum]|uniref:Uncharacterized protein n=1 Tax=Endocarpon pusillum TaxID=364733 RepID=A0A8H7AUW1_9EURO|nr:hypothetical protein GJ744_008910 [Endocarpon pusillum]